MSKRITAKVDTYDKDGQTKGKYVNIGVILENDNGEFLLLDPTVNLAGVLTQQNLLAQSEGKQTRGKVMCSIFSDEPQQQSAPTTPPTQGAPSGFDDDEIVF